MERRSRFASVENTGTVMETLINGIIVHVDVGELRHRHTQTQTCGPISDNLKHLRSEETLEGVANM